MINSIVFSVYDEQPRTSADDYIRNPNTLPRLTLNRIYSRRDVSALYLAF
jgi:hypothetical protein